MLTIKRLEEMNKNRTALVCGSTQGIGFAVANQLAKNGYNLILMARNEEKLNSALARMDVSQGQHHQYLVADFSKPTELKSVIDAFIQKGNRIHVLVNNTGGPKGGLIKDLEGVWVDGASKIVIEITRVHYTDGKNCSN